MNALNTDILVALVRHPCHYSTHFYLDSYDLALYSHHGKGQIPGVESLHGITSMMLTLFLPLTILGAAEKSVRIRLS